MSLDRLRRCSPLPPALVLLVSISQLGCEIDMKLGELDDPSTSAASTTDDDPDGSSTASTTAASGHTGVAEDTSTGSATSGGLETTDDAGDTGAEVCMPLPEDLGVFVNFDAEPAFDNWDVTMEADCTVVSVSERGNERRYLLECDEGGNAPVNHLLVVERTSGPIDLPLAAGTPIHLQVNKVDPIDTPNYHFIVVRDAAGEIVLARYQGDPALSKIPVDLDAWFAPLEHSLAFGDCEPVPPEDGGGMFIMDPCPAAETRLALDFQLGDETIHLLEHTSGQLGPLSLWVASARHLDPVGKQAEGCHPRIDDYSFVAYREG